MLRISSSSAPASARSGTSRVAGLALVATLALVLPLSRAASDPQIETIQKGQTRDLYFEINLSGKVYVKVGTPPGGSNCAEFWWVKWPFGNIESLGRHCGSTSFDIPGLTDLAVSSKLRVGGTSNTVQVAISAKESVANTATFHF